MKVDAINKKTETKTDKVKEHKKVYFSGLNGLRFIAATVVIFHHIEQNKYWLDFPSVWGQAGIVGNFVDALGHKAVSFFYVLSGFLISYLLLDENRKSGTINVGKFYVRRILRIWPLYYLLVVVAFLFLPSILNMGDYPDQIATEFRVILLVLYVFMLPNLARLTSQTVIGMNQAWSIGVEEQFYIIWPILVKRFKTNFLNFLLCFIVIKMGIGLLLMGAYEFSLVPESFMSKMPIIIKFWNLLQIEQMAVGAIGAYYLFHNNEKFLKFIYNPLSGIIAIIIWAFIMVSGLHFFGLTVVEGLVFLVITMNFSLNNKFPIKLEGKWINFMGNISYGIYMYHTLVIAIVLKFISPYFQDMGNVVFNIVLYVLATIITWVLAAVSYKMFEMPFLKLKEKFQIIKSSDKE